MTLPPCGRTQKPLTNNAEGSFQSVVVALLQCSGFRAVSAVSVAHSHINDFDS